MARVWNGPEPALLLSALAGPKACSRGERFSRQTISDLSNSNHGRDSLSYVGSHICRFQPSLNVLVIQQCLITNRNWRMRF